MRRIVTAGSVLAALMAIYLMNPVLAWAALAGTAAFFSLRRSRQVAPQSANR